MRDFKYLNYLRISGAISCRGEREEDGGDVETEARRQQTPERVGKLLEVR